MLCIIDFRMRFLQKMRFVFFAVAMLLIAATLKTAQETIKPFAFGKTAGAETT
jgi:hypothetical protein